MSLFTRGPADPDLVTPASAAYSTLRTIRASAQKVTMRSRSEIEQFVATRNRSASKSSWQSLAWDYYDEIGEVKYAFGLLANTVSRIRLYSAVNVDPSRAPDPVAEVPDLTPGMAEVADRALARLDSGFGGISGVLRDISICLNVPGEAYLVQIPERRAPDLSVIPESWGIFASDALIVESPGRVSLMLTRDARVEDYIVLPPEAFVGRIWRSHSRYPGETDSSMRGLLGLMEELLLLNRTVRATARSRLNAGMLYLPDGLSASSTSPATPDTGEDVEEDEFENDLIEAMITPLSDESSASAVVPLIVRGPSDMGEKIKYFQFERTFDPALSERADRVLDRILQGLDVPKEIIQGLSQVKYALSTDAQILTRSGWKAYDEVEVGEDVLTLNHITGQSEWQPLRKINIHDHDGPMLRMSSRTHSSLSTPEHQWATVKTGKKVSGSRRRWTTSAAGFTSTDRVETAVECATLPIEAKYTDDFVRLVALYSSDGWREVPVRGSMRANITKTTRNRNAHAISTVQALVSRIDPGYAEYEHVSAAPDGTPVTGMRFRLTPDASDALFGVVEGADKIIRCDFISSLTYAQLTLFLDTLIEIGDGNVVNGNPRIRRYWQTDRARLEPIALAGVLSGHTVRWLPTPIVPNENSLVPQSQPCWGLTVTRVRSSFFPHATEQEWEHYTGQVWCPTTDNQTWLARQNGTVFYTGNSNAVVIDDQFYRTHVEPLTLLICDALTTVYLRPYLIAHGFTPEQAKRVVVWYDPSDIQVRPNRSDDATTGYDRYVLSGSAWRKVHGFAETDKPDPSEVLQRLVIEKGQIPDALTEALLRVIAPLMMNEAQAANPEIDANLPPEVQQALGVPPSVAPAPSAPDVPEPTAEQSSPTPPPAPPVQPRQTPTAPPGA